MAFGLTGILALLAILAAGAIRARAERAVLAGALVAAALLWPTPTLAGGLRASPTLDPVRAWRELRTSVTAAELVPREALALAGKVPGSLFVFPLQSGFAAEAGRPLAANVDQVYGAHTPEMQAEVVESLLFVARFRARCRAAGVGEVTVAGKYVRFAPVELPESRVVRLQRLYPRSIVKAPVSTILVPRPQTAAVAGRPVAGVALLEWARGVIDEVIDPPTAAAAPVKPTGSDS